MPLPNIDVRKVCCSFVYVFKQEQMQLTFVGLTMLRFCRKIIQFCTLLILMKLNNIVQLILKVQVPDELYEVARSLKVTSSL